MENDPTDRNKIRLLIYPSVILHGSVNLQSIINQANLLLSADMCVSCFYGDGMILSKSKINYFFFQIDKWSGYQEWNHHWQPKSNNSIIQSYFIWLIGGFRL